MSNEAPKGEYLMFLAREELNKILNKSDIGIESTALDIINKTQSPKDVFAIYYTNPDIRIIRAELITPENFSEYLKP